ncbi:helix-turn-helix transcriptional regulator, partial [Porticoccus sp.]
IDLFLKGAYLLDPCYRAAQAGHEGFYRLDQLAPVGFRNSEYYKNYFRHTGLIDECGYLFHLNGDLLNISLGRDDHHQRFSQAQQQLLRDIAPLLQALYLGHWHRADHLPHQDDGLHRQLSAALAYFGTSVLTEREAQVIQLFLHGHSTKSIAQKLAISPETVKLHRKHSYAKLDISSQSELFYLFIDALSSMSPPCDGDPLVGYLGLVR